MKTCSHGEAEREFCLSVLVPPLQDVVVAGANLPKGFFIRKQVGTDVERFALVHGEKIRMVAVHRGR